MHSIRIPWKDSFRSGHDAIDDQHRELIELINELMDRLAANCPMPAIRYYLAAIHELIAEHFAEEEMIMRAAGYAGATAHKVDHDRLLVRIRAVMDEVEQSRRDLSKHRLARTLDDWFSIHFRTYDRAFHQLVDATPNIAVEQDRSRHTSA